MRDFKYYAIGVLMVLFFAFCQYSILYGQVDFETEEEDDYISFLENLEIYLNSIAVDSNGSSDADEWEPFYMDNQHYSFRYAMDTVFLEEPEILIGDVNQDGMINMGDITYILNWIYFDGPELPTINELYWTKFNVIADKFDSLTVNIEFMKYMIGVMFVLTPNTWWPDNAPNYPTGFPDSLLRGIKRDLEFYR